ncbi:unnamed protein product [Arctia plantaginis]|uniref:Uncharacterized protein n=1 Tax=Arctia plantaginis TaxID=874455 RepID=A0A8S0ZQQ3_ARCPL|nr:unnamed protein product [Arctia plantaginis]
MGFEGIIRCLEMLNLSPSGYREIDDSERTVNRKKVYSRRPWYAPAIDPAEILRQRYSTQDYVAEYNPEGEERRVKQSEEYYDRDHDYEEPVTSQQLEGLGLGPVDSSPPNPYYEQAPTTNSVSEFSLANAVNLREAVLVASGGASAALLLLIIMAGVFMARRRKNSPSPVPSPPILVYPPHDISAPCYM